MKNKVYICIVTWNSEKYLSDLFLSLHNMDYDKSDWHLVVVDNGSKDKTKDILASWQTKMHNFDTIIHNTENKGFAEGTNQAIKYALDQKADNIALLNDDTVVEPDWLTKIVEAMDKDKNLGLVQPLITRYPDTSKVNKFGNAYQYLGFGFCYGEGESIKNFNTNSYEPAYLSFTAVVIRPEVLKSIGLLDNNYFSYHEDSDFCFRARLAGWSMLALSSAVVHHNYKFPSKKNKIRYFWLEKNRYYLLLKFFKLKTLLLIAPMCLIMELGLIFFSITRGFFFERLKAYWWIIRNFATILKQRKRIQKERKADDYALYDFMTGKIEFQQLNNPLLTYIGNPMFNLYFKIIKKYI